ncbi:hypothetical protein COO60DRAFT_289316 [Scenedesmus sp. NREL 46B-D3]|nr:hypothetical protein COO60DRAFT_289316 [Scenedesmus sp. NREL 46B-D3]
MSAGTARTLARKAAAAFPCTTTLRIMLYHNEKAELSFDLTADDDAPVCTWFPSAKLDRPEAAIILLRRFGQSVDLQELQLQLPHIGRFSSLSKMLPLAPRLVVLDLSGCRHQPSDLLAVAEHLQQLQQLLLHCQEFSTLSGCRRSSGSAAWPRMGGNTCYEPAHIAALAQLPQLRLLECPVPTGGLLVETGGGDGAHPWACEWLESIAKLTQLTAVHLIQGKAAWAGYPLPAAAVSCLSALTGLQHLRADAGGGRFASSHSADVGVQQGEGWALALRGMQQLTRLEMTRVLVCDPLLRVIGAAGMPLLRVLVLEALDMLGEVATSAEGANALAHIPRMELLFNKGMSCKQHMALLELPNIKRLVNCKQ